MKKILPYIAIVLVIIAFIAVIPTRQKDKANFAFIAPTQSPAPKVKTLKIKDKELLVVVSDTEEKRSKGLGGVASLTDTEGMLFIFDSDNIIPPFWMKGMIMPIDIIWINDGKVADMDLNLAPPMKENDSLPTYSPGTPIDYVLEVRAGFAKDYNIKIGDPVIIFLQ